MVIILKIVLTIISDLLSCKKYYIDNV